ncbi:uncharacterized protein RCC_06537 [Ramularia collo-cygni]|uniref:Uncharacterized protein n=1 Tax=Ramularia collo-cygni TaxID=112498 RepID=A0A2D3VFQ4_9PEZI|nr:uncharacterized protein RCC_06537 [Ramularia collo-cygni]CZT20679.1 uncharacterized protein RCC_06537 [Ramularia collo-cygni]
MGILRSSEMSQSHYGDHERNHCYVCGYRNLSSHLPLRSSIHSHGHGCCCVPVRAYGKQELIES